MTFDEDEQRDVDAPVVYPSNADQECPDCVCCWWWQCARFECRGRSCPCTEGLYG